MDAIAPGAIAAAGARVLGCRIGRVERLAGSVGNQDFMLSTSIGDFVLKASQNQDLVAEAWACQRALRGGVVAPEIVGLEDEAHNLPMPFLIMRKLPGSPVEGPSPALIEAGQQLALVHSIQVAGYGALAIDGDDAVGTSDSWRHFVAGLTSGLEQLVAADIVSDPLADAASAALDQSTDDLGFDRPAVLLHGDLKPAHIFASSAGCTGLIDWGDACAGDPRLDLGRMSMAGPTVFAAFMSGYGLPVTPELDRALACYRLLWNIDALTYEFRANGDWFDSYRSGIESAVNDLATNR